MLADQHQRELALDPTQSFIVQAPAGSGKTELLIQRYLILLAQVEQSPEEVMAITFTRKAAAEMQARVLNTLTAASEQDESMLSGHRLQTWKLAHAVLMRDQQLGWDIRDNPHRLRIHTIDSLCNKITVQMPILAQFGVQPDISADMDKLYEEAALEVLESLESDPPWHEALKHLLLYLDNDYSKTKNLLVAMLKRRDQWLPHIVNHNPREILEAALQSVIAEQLQQLARLFPFEFQQELLVLLRFAQGNLQQGNESATSSSLRGAERRGNPDISAGLPRRSAPRNDEMDFYDFPDGHLIDLTPWLTIAKFLLTKEGQWRKAFTVRDGFPPEKSASDAVTKTLYSEMKQRVIDLLKQLEKQSGLLNAFQALLELPPPIYQETQWQCIQALIVILPITVAALHNLFKDAGEVDYTEIALRAIDGLGSLEQPSDIALALDYKIRHLLVDEFQDTSVTQFRLLQRLTADWQNGDGRTLFLVGDPMQSIYRFRKAEVGLFLQVQSCGINAIQLQPLTLRVNFRSTAAIVSWINQTFAQIFPEANDLGTGAILYSPSVAFSDAEENECVEASSPSSPEDETAPAIVWHIHVPDGLQERMGNSPQRMLFDGGETTRDSMLKKNNTAVNFHALTNEGEVREGDVVREIIEEVWRKNPEHTIGILVRGREHLTPILPSLRAANIPYRAVEIEKLTMRPVIQDLLALTRALLQPNDRIAWLAILRAPWCGLTLADLIALVGDDLQAPIWGQMNSRVSFLSEAGQQRLMRIMPILTHSIEQRCRAPLAQAIEATWLALGGPACESDELALLDAQVFFQLLAEFDQGQSVLDFVSLERCLDKRFASPQQSSENCVEVMTIHKSKGLEFDTVILPGLHRQTRQDDHQLLLWEERPTILGESALLVAPIKQAATDSDSAIYDYLRLQERKRTSNETSRLLYVAASRARSALHLLAKLEVAANKENEARLMQGLPLQTNKHPCDWLAHPCARQSAKAIPAPGVSVFDFGDVKKPGNGSLLEKLWVPCEVDFINSMGNLPNIVSEKIENNNLGLSRLTLDWQNPLVIKPFEDEEKKILNLLSRTQSSQTMRHVGTVIHRLFYQLSKHGFDLPIKRTMLEIMLQSAGVSTVELEHARQQVEKALQNVLADPKGRWILDAAREEAQSEFPLTFVQEKQNIHLVLDRTFVDAGVRWIIDYKLTEPKEGQTLAEFLHHERKAHQQQLQQYAQALSFLDDNPIKMGLYFPLVPVWCEWE